MPTYVPHKRLRKEQHLPCHHTSLPEPLPCTVGLPLYAEKTPHATVLAC